MKKFTFFICFVLCFLFTVFSACGTNSSEKSEGQHQETVVSTDNDLLKDGVSEYKIVKPANASAKETIAAEELTDLFRLSTGFTLLVVTDDTVNYTTESKYIFVGRTLFLERFGINADYTELGEQGFLIKNVDKSIVITGALNNCYGTIYGVYEFLSKQIGFECYFNDEIYVRPSANLKLVDFKTFIDKPDIPLVASQTSLQGSDMLYRLRNRFISINDDVFSAVAIYHNSFVYLNPSTYYEEHPKWYSDDKTQICYYAHNDKAEYEEMVNTLFGVFKKLVLENENVKHLAFMIQDTTTWCGCDVCSAMATNETISSVKPGAYSGVSSDELLFQVDKAGYGANSAGCIMLLNRVSEKFAADKDVKDRELDFWFFAYNRTYGAPVTKNEKGELVPTSPDVICRDNVYPLVCTFDKLRSRTITDTKNAAIKETVDAWGVLAKKMAFWTYTENYNDWLAPRDNITMMQEDYRYYKSKNPVFYKEEAQSKNVNAPGFGNLKIWLSYKLAWNVDADVNALIKEFFEHYFKDAADTMYEFYTSYILTLNRNRELYNYSQQDNSSAVKEEYYSYGVVNHWLKLLDKAYQDISYLKSEDSELYEKLFNRICIEGITVKYTKLVLYKNNMSNVEFEQLKKETIADAKRVNMTFFNDLSATIEDQINGMVK